VGEPARDADGSIFGMLLLNIDGTFSATAGEDSRFSRTERQDAAGTWGIEAFVAGGNLRHLLVLTLEDGSELSYAFRSIAEDGGSFDLDDQPVTQTFDRTGIL
jgi:hypothetical protein